MMYEWCVISANVAGERVDKLGKRPAVPFDSLPMVVIGDTSILGVSRHINDLDKEKMCNLVCRISKSRY